MPRSRCYNHIAHVFEQFDGLGELISVHPHGNGHINDTFLLTCRKNRKASTLILQHINREVFKNPNAVMANFSLVTDHVRARLQRLEIPEIERRVLCLIPSKTGATHVYDPDGQPWRMLHYIHGATSHDVMDHPGRAFEAGKAFGLFQSWLADLDASLLSETIPHFHDTPRRLAALRAAFREDAMGRAGDVCEDVELAFAYSDKAATVVDGLRDGTIPLRITHNDTKLNNVLMDDMTDEGICVIDLDTVMPGSILYDFGDLVRTATNSAPEDEMELERISVRMDIFESLTAGYLSAAGEFLTEREIDLLSFGAELLAFENGVRFLTDYLQGDRYFRIHREAHNLDRARAQFRLSECFRAAQDHMAAIVRNALPAAAASSR